MHQDFTRADHPSEATPLDYLEPERLAALYRLDILDTPAEPEFDELVELAAAICGVPISLVTLLDDRRQWFKAVFGISLQETAREIAFCNQTIKQSGLLHVYDATLDDRFAGNPVVTNDPHLRFYAGVPISSPDGFPLGSLCVLDVVPRSLTPLQAQALSILAHQVNARLQLRAQRISLAHALDATREANQRLHQLATTDPLTGLSNRRSFEERLTAAYNEATLEDRNLSILLLDADNFKRLNDTYGHDAGDDTLQQLARLFRSVARAEDMVVRYGGEEFLILLPDTGEAQASHLGTRILDVVRQYPWPNTPVTVSIGSSSLGPATPSGQRLVTLADEALYAAKRSGKDRLVSYGIYFKHLVNGFDGKGELPQSTN